LVLSLLFSWISFPAFASQTSSLESIDTSEPVSREIVYRYLAEYLISSLPKSYHSIALKFDDVTPDTKLYEALQKLVYVDVIENEETQISPKKSFNAYDFYADASEIIDEDILDDTTLEATKARIVTVKDLMVVQTFIKQLKKQISDKSNIQEISIQNITATGGEFSSLTPEEYKKFRMLLDVYDTLQTEHYDSANLTQTGLLYGAMWGMADSTKDKFTTFFPPAQSQNFNESLSWEFEGIGAYVEMPKPWVLTIISPINDSPAQLSGLKGGDIITTIDGKKVIDTMTVTDCVALIKGPSGTKVKIEILRGDQTLSFEVTRAKITINDVSSKVLNDSYYYIQISMFGDKVSEQFSKAVDDFQLSGKKKLIIDLRDNPGGYLDRVTDMLSLFVPNWEPTAVVKYKNGELPYLSKNQKSIPLADYQVYILINSGTASASEIFTGTLKDYFSGIVVLGEQSYGKGSVQTVRSYYDGSSLKYTIAKWYTGKTQKTIDKVGITPDVKLTSDPKAPKAIDTLSDPRIQYILSNYGG